MGIKRVIQSDMTVQYLNIQHQKNLYHPAYMMQEGQNIQKKGCSEFEAQFNTLLELKELFQFDFKEVKSSG